ncbi:MAG: VOC family protein, partial [Gemmatimonadota bacterium]|nr:VOC family protein [Gemmatimonadota bacterium]
MRLGVAVLLASFTACAGAASDDEDPTDRASPTTRGAAAAARGIVANNAFFYYADVDAATRFYTGTLGLEIAADYGFAKILRIGATSYLTLVDAERGMHSADEPKTVALALVTDQLDAWWEYVDELGLPLRSGYEPEEGSPHHGFVVIDPEGYYLEFERFNPHPENERFTPLLDAAPTLRVGGRAGEAPGDLGFKATVLWLYYRDIPGMRRFYENELGLDMIVDQGLAKIYPTSRTGFIGLVDETRGMHSYTEDKAVTLSFLTDDLDAWFEHARAGAFELRSDSIETGNPRYRAFVGYDPEGYFVEFDTFLDHFDNQALLEAIE